MSDHKTELVQEQKTMSKKNNDSNQGSHDPEAPLAPAEIVLATDRSCPKKEAIAPRNRATDGGAEAKPVFTPGYMCGTCIVMSLCILIFCAIPTILIILIVRRRSQDSDHDAFLIDCHPSGNGPYDFQDRRLLQPTVTSDSVLAGVSWERDENTGGWLRGSFT